MFGEILLIFAMEPKQKMAAETFILHSDPKFMCLQNIFLSTVPALLMDITSNQKLYFWGLDYHIKNV